MSWRHFVVKYLVTTLSGTIRRYFKFASSSAGTRVDRLCDKGIHCDVAMDEIREFYGYETKSTKIIDDMLKDRQWYKVEGGIHPNLL